MRSSVPLQSLTFRLIRLSYFYDFPFFFLRILEL
jgi:hypothetical protein